MFGDGNKKVKRKTDTRVKACEKQVEERGITTRENKERLINMQDTRTAAWLHS